MVIVKKNAHGPPGLDKPSAIQSDSTTLDKLYNVIRPVPCLYPRSNAQFSMIVEQHVAGNWNYYNRIYRGDIIMCLYIHVDIELQVYIYRMHM